MIIVGDIGNTETKICLFNDKKKLLKKKVFDTYDFKNTNLSEKFKFLNAYRKKIDKTMFSSVVPNVFKNIKRTIKKKIRVEIKELKQLSLKKILKIEVNTRQVGSDRLANAISAINNKDNFIILDFGTATTFDVLVKNIYHGGIISPGIRLSLNTLIDNASLIPNLKLKKINKVIGLNTVNAVRSGFFWGYRGLIDNIVKLIKKETRKSFKIIITGGFSHLFNNFYDKKVTINKDITIMGLIKASSLIK